MISQGLWDTADWSNDAEDSTLHVRNKLHFKMYYIGKQLFYHCNMSQYYFFLLLFDQNINAAFF